MRSWEVDGELVEGVGVLREGGAAVASRRVAVLLVLSLGSLKGGSIPMRAERGHERRREDAESKQNNSALTQGTTAQYEHLLALASPCTLVKIPTSLATYAAERESCALKEAPLSTSPNFSLALSPTSSPAMTSKKEVGTTRNLTDLLPASSSATAVHLPSPDVLVALLAARYRQEHTSTYVGDSTLVVLNPLRTLSDVNEASKAEYEDRAYKVRGGAGGEEVQPHAYDLACRVYLVMRRTGETQGVVFRCVLGWERDAGGS